MRPAIRFERQHAPAEGICPWNNSGRVDGVAAALDAGIEPARPGCGSLSIGPAIDRRRFFGSVPAWDARSLRSSSGLRGLAG